MVKVLDKCNLAFVNFCEELIMCGYVGMFWIIIST